MWAKTIPAIAILTMLCSVCEAQLIRCYACSTTGGAYSDKCGDRFSLQPTEASYCRGTCFKIRGYRDAGKGDQLEIHRGCGLKEGDSCTKGDYFGMKADICKCNEELCNTGSTVVISKWTCGLTTALSIVLALLLQHLV